MLAVLPGEGVPEIFDSFVSTLFLFFLESLHFRFRLSSYKTLTGCLLEGIFSSFVELEPMLDFLVRMLAFVVIVLVFSSLAIVLVFSSLVLGLDNPEYHCSFWNSSVNGSSKYVSATSGLIRILFLGVELLLLLI